MPTTKLAVLAKDSLSKDVARKLPNRDRKKNASPSLGVTFTAAVKSFFQEGCLLKQVDCTVIALKHKVSNASFLKDFRPISYCNTIYKCITKILAKRMGSIMHNAQLGGNNANNIHRRKVDRGQYFIGSRDILELPSE